MVALMAVSCVDSLNTSPIDDNVVTSNQVFENPENFKKVLAWDTGCNQSRLQLQDPVRYNL